MNMWRGIAYTSLLPCNLENVDRSEGVYDHEGGLTHWCHKKPGGHFLFECNTLC